MLQKLFAYALVATAILTLLTSTARISVAILSLPRSPAVEFDVDLEDEDGQLDQDPILPINRRKLAVSQSESGPGAVSNVLPALLGLSSRRRSIDERNLPYKCGVIMYDHNVPGEGGDMLDEWIEQLADSSEGASFFSSRERESKESFLGELEKHTSDIGSNEWKFIKSRDYGLALAEDENVLRSGRDAVERKSCQFVAAIVLLDPLDHSIRKTKQQFSKCNCTIQEYKSASMAYLDENPWMGQLDQFLFNSGGGTLMEMKDKVKRGVQLLMHNFDVVVVDDVGDFASKIAKITGLFAASKIREADVSDSDLVYSKDLVTKFTKMHAKNGDTDFIDAVNHIYHSRLDSLF